MSKRRTASILMFGKKNCLKYPVSVVAIASGTGTNTGAHVLSVSASAQTVYLNLTAATNIGTLVGTTGA